MLTGSGLFALLSRDLEQRFGQIVSIRVKTLYSNTKFGSDFKIQRRDGNENVA